MTPNEGASTSAFVSGADDLGVFTRVSVDPSFFSDVAILKTAYWFTDKYYVFLAKNRASGFVDVEFRLKEGDSLDYLTAACGEFWNSLLDQEVRQKILLETASVRDTLLKKAFFEGKARLPSGTVSDESHLPEAGELFRDDRVGSTRPDV